ncbi:MAG: hypothetical protein H0V64_03475 [Geodermatophilaceae bacterium]|nr:hypothetical protein [Geodermatophilaceae bacterium]
MAFTPLAFAVFAAFAVLVADSASGSASAEPAAESAPDVSATSVRPRERVDGRGRDGSDATSDG